MVEFQRLVSLLGEFVALQTVSSDRSLANYFNEHGLTDRSLDLNNLKAGMTERCEKRHPGWLQSSKNCSGPLLLGFSRLC